MNEISNDVFSEVYGFLKLLDKSYIEKIPEELRNLINEKRNLDYSPKYNFYIPINNQKLSKEALTIITVINLNYWADENEKKEINKILARNSEIHEKEIREKYNVDNLFKNTNLHEGTNKLEKTNNEEILPKKAQTTFFRKILNKITQFIRRIKNNK